MPLPKSARIRTPSTQAARNNAIGADARAKRTRNPVEDEPEASPSPESSPTKKRDSDGEEKASESIAAPLAKSKSVTVADDVDHSTGEDDSASEYNAADIDGVAAAWADADADDAVSGVASNDNQSEEPVPSLPVNNKSKKSGKKKSRNSSPLLDLSDSEDMPDASEILMIAPSGVQVVSKPMRYDSSKVSSPNKRAEVISLSSGDEGPDDKVTTPSKKGKAKKTSAAKKKGKGKKVEAVLDDKSTVPKDAPATPAKADGFPPSTIRTPARQVIRNAPVTSNPKTPPATYVALHVWSSVDSDIPFLNSTRSSKVQVGASPQTPSRARPKLDVGGLKAALASPFKKTPVAGWSNHTVPDGHAVVYDDLYKRGPSFVYIPSNLFAISSQDMMLHHNPLLHNIDTFLDLFGEIDAGYDIFSIGLYFY
ncbi:hypothetical protein C8J56DRAFT_888998 [Mycena floridula]|nr:hypothetical protein C8J56DRAFT_888998 [Mycena floridula]